MNPGELAIHNERLEKETPEARLAFAVETFGDKLLFTSSFGAGSGVLLHLWSQVARHLPVVVIDTGFLFEETIAYRERLTHLLGLKIEIVRPATPKAEFLAKNGADIYRTNPDFCCEQNKIEPLRPRIAIAEGWVTGLRRDQSSDRAETPILLASDGGPIKVHPLATMSAGEATAYMERHAIPEHPLRAEGFHSIGCAPCPRAVLPGEEERAGRWSGSSKTECGLHTRLVRPRSG